MNSIHILDTTLRDGMQGRNVNFSIKDKIQIALKLDELKIDYIEGGFPASNIKEIEFFRQMKREKLNHSKLVSFGSTRHVGNKPQNDPNMNALLETETSTVIIVGKASLNHVENILNIDAEQNLELIFDSIAYLKAEGRETFFDLEHFFDGYRDNPEYAVKVLEAASSAGADVLVLCDTNGGMLPDDIHRIVNVLPKDDLSPLGIHCHNDTGCAVANSLISINSGVRHVQGTMNGWGERCGNANLCTLLPNLSLKTDYSISSATELGKLTELSKYLYEKANIQIDDRQPYVGEAAFSHKAGLHVDVIKKAPSLIEHIDSSVVGNSRYILLSELSGKATIIEKLKPFGNFSKNSPEVIDLINKLKVKESSGYQYESAEASFNLIIRKSLNKYAPVIKEYSYQVESLRTGEQTPKTICDIVISAENGKQLSGKWVGTDSINTLHMAMLETLSTDYNFINNIHISDYKLRSISSDSEFPDKYLVTIVSTDNNANIWATIGVSDDQNEASLEALVDSYEYYYNNLNHDV